MATEGLTELFGRLEAQLAGRSLVRWEGRVLEMTGNLVESEGPEGAVGEAVDLLGAGGARYRGEIIGFRGARVLSMVAEEAVGIRFGDRIVARGERPSVPVGEGLLGRVVNAQGEAIDGLGPVRSTGMRALDAGAPRPMERVAIREPLGCGVRALDTMVTCGRGQRLGVFGGSGVGKSTLLGMMARGTQAEVTVMALVGERGREVGEFLEVLGEEGQRRAVVVVSTSDQSPLERLRAPMAATAMAEAFAAEGRDVLLVVDSLTRFAMAQREIGLAAGEPPTVKGYTPSVLNKLARLVERAGNFGHGSITAFYTVLMEGDDQQDPVVDTVRSLLDGHIMLDRALAARGQYPPIAVLDSLSRLMPSLVGEAHRERARTVRSLLSAYARSEDLIRIGAYQRGTDELLDRAITAEPLIRMMLAQRSEERCTFEQSSEALLGLAI